MSFVELPGALGVVYAPFPLPAAAERSRNKERLEASLSGLYELELLKQRQESLVLGALLLGDSPLSGRPDAPNGIAGGHARQIVSFYCHLLKESQMNPKGGQTLCNASHA